MIVTPTLLKSYDNPTLPRIWDEAIHVFGQATDVVLVGYSFPLADHDFRYLLRKAVASFSRVWVVLHDTENPRRWPEHVGALLPEARYRGLFGLGDDAFFYGGWEAFFQSVLRE
jgi:hypothetical protein